MRADAERTSWLIHGEANSEISEIDLSVDRGMPSIAKRRRGGGAGPIGIDDALRRAARRRCVALRQRGEAALVIARSPVDVHADGKARGKGLRAGRARKNSSEYEGRQSQNAHRNLHATLARETASRRSLGAAPCAKLHTSRETGLPCDVNSRSRVPRPTEKHDPDKSMPLRATNAKAFARRPCSDNG